MGNTVLYAKPIHVYGKKNNNKIGFNRKTNYKLLLKIA